ncbi:MAG: NAD(P)-dependent oxidoreductase, partial [Elioraea sp.]|nr:NAD(P)-dependent oxidoreductase [Elioraea sp.]
RGHAVRGWDTALGRRDEAQAAGIAVAEDATAGAEIVLLSLPDDAAVRAVAERLPAAGLRAGAVVVDTSTVSPATPRALAPPFAAIGLGWLDAPVSGGPAGAAEGRLVAMAGGEAETLAAARPVLDDLAHRVVHVGPPGAGAVAKLANNLLLAANVIAAAEAIALARRAGVEPARVLDAINGASGRSAATEVNLPRWILSGRFDSGFTAGQMRKDLRLARALADGVGFAEGLVLEAVRLWLDSPVPDAADFNRVPAAVLGELGHG